MSSTFDKTLGGAGLGGAAADDSKAAGDDIILMSQEGERFPVPRRVAQMSELVKTLTDDAGSNEEVPLMDVKTPVLAKVIEFCRHHVDNKLPEIEKVGAPRPTPAPSGGWRPHASPQPPLAGARSPQTHPHAHTCTPACLPAAVA